MAITQETAGLGAADQTQIDKGVGETGRDEDR